MDEYDIRRMGGSKPWHETVDTELEQLRQRIAELEAEMALWPSEVGRSADGGDGR